MEWKDCNRYDLKMIPVMESHGYRVDFKWDDLRFGNITPDNPPNESVSFVKGDLHVWKTMYGWQTAKLKKGRYCDHHHIDKLENIIN